jgi:hypothetical protein
VSEEIKRLPLLLQVQPTEQFGVVNGEWARLWQGVDADGRQYVLWVTAAAGLCEQAGATLAEVLGPETHPLIIVPFAKRPT